MSESKQNNNVTSEQSASNNASEYTYDPDASRLKRVKSLLSTYPNNLFVQPLNGYVLSLHAIIRNTTTPQPEFVRNSDLLLKLLCEYALSQLEYTNKQVT